VRFVGRRWLFEGVPEVDLIDVMGEASRDESTAIAQRLAAVGELYARRAVEWAERNLWSADPLDAVSWPRPHSSSH
jgi:hypothetical protein